MPAKQTNPDQPNVAKPGAPLARWPSPLRQNLLQIISNGAGKQLPAVFDFDDTIVRGDIGETTLAWLVKSGVLTPDSWQRETAGPGVEDHGGRNPMERYQKLLTPTVHGSDDPAPLANGYAWAVTAMAGLPLAEVLRATDEVMAVAERQPAAGIKIAPGLEPIPLPEFHPEMVELLGELIRSEYEVWIISASNVWSVRRMVLRGLNPRLHAAGVEQGIRMDHIVGTCTLLADADGRRFKDAVLVRENPAYAQLAAAEMNRYHLTSHLQYPLPAYSGKLACVFDAIGRWPYLCAGNAPSDAAMMQVSEHQLWIETGSGAGMRPFSARLGQISPGNSAALRLTHRQTPPPRAHTS